MRKASEFAASQLGLAAVKPAVEVAITELRSIPESESDTFVWRQLESAIRCALGDEFEPTCKVGFHKDDKISATGA